VHCVERSKNFQGQTVYEDRARVVWEENKVKKRGTKIAANQNKDTEGKSSEQRENKNKNTHQPGKERLGARGGKPLVTRRPCKKGG